VPDDCGRHHPDRPGAGDDDVLADDGPLQRRVDGIAERVEEDAEVRVELARLHPRVGRGDDDVVGEGPVTVDPDADRVDAHVLAAGPAVATVPADDMALPRHSVPDADVLDVHTHLDDLAEELVPQRLRHLHRRRRPVVVVVQVEVGATESGAQNPDLDVLLTAHGLGNVDEFETGTWGDLPQCAHDTHPCVCRGSGGQKTPLGARRAPFGGVTAPTDRFGPPARRRPARNRCARHTSSSMLAPESGNGACSDFFGGDPQ
jgi:hypothetical protein